MSCFPFRAAGASLVLAASLFCVAQSSCAQDAAGSRIVVTGEELPSAYGAPPGFSRTRVSPSVTAYVLPPGAVLAATIWEGDFFRHGKPDHLFTQEIEIGLPHRFGAAVEFGAEVFNGVRQMKAVSIEGRYALADWNKIPLNPTLFAEYKFGTGRVLREEGGGEEGDEDMEAPDELRRKLSHRITRAAEEDGEDEEEGGERPNQPDAVEGRLLLAQDFGEHFEWALNGFVEQETSGDRGREWGFAQSIDMPLTHDERVKIGLEMEYKNFTDKDTRDDPAHSFVIGPNVSWKPNRWSRFDVAPLFGVTDDSPRVQVFVVFSMVFGGSERHEAEAPISTRNR